MAFSFRKWIPVGTLALQILTIVGGFVTFLIFDSKLKQNEVTKSATEVRKLSAHPLNGLQAISISKYNSPVKTDKCVVEYQYSIENKTNEKMTILAISVQAFVLDGNEIDQKSDYTELPSLLGGANSSKSPWKRIFDRAYTTNQEAIPFHSETGAEVRTETNDKLLGTLELGQKIWNEVTLICNSTKGKYVAFLFEINYRFEEDQREDKHDSMWHWAPILEGDYPGNFLESRE